jgi:hypothetical protein
MNEMDMINAMQHDGLIGRPEEINLLRQLQKNFNAAVKLYITAGTFPRKHIEFARRKFEHLNREQRLAILRLIRNRLQDPDDWQFTAATVRLLVDIDDLPGGASKEPPRGELVKNEYWPLGRFWPAENFDQCHAKSRTANLIRTYPGCDAAFLRQNGANCRTLYRYVRSGMVIQKTYDSSNCATEWSRLVPEAM